MKESPQVFDRIENKFFVPVAQSALFTAEMESLATSIGLEKEQYKHKVNRTIYYFPGNINGFTPGFGVRYRDYASDTFTNTSNVQGLNGSYELKCTDEAKSGVKKKIKIIAPFYSKMTVATLKKLISDTTVDVETQNWFIKKLDEQKLDDQTLLTPFAAVSYERVRFVKNKNVFNIDSNLKIYAVDIDNAASPSFSKTGEYAGLICELKENSEDVHTRWQIYRRLVKHDAERFYSKKGHALNLLHYHNVEKLNPVKLINELPGNEMEVKINIEEPNQATQILASLYQTMERPDNLSGFFVAPDCQVFSSQSTINQYFIDKDNPEIEQKLLLRLGRYKYSGKNAVSKSENVYGRKEDKGVVYDFSREKVRRERGNFVNVGKVIRTRNSFWIYSPTDRAYKVSVDINRKLPFILEQTFCQLEIEYSGLCDRPENSPSPFANTIIENELKSLNSQLDLLLTNLNIKHGKGGRKADILQNS